MLCLYEETSSESTKKKVIFKFQTLLQNHKFNTLYARHINTVNLFEIFSRTPFRIQLFQLFSFGIFSFSWILAIKGLIKILHNFSWFEEAQIDDDLLDMKFECFVSPETWWLWLLCCPALTNLSAFSNVKHSRLLFRCGIILARDKFNLIINAFLV